MTWIGKVTPEHPLCVFKGKALNKEGFFFFFWVTVLQLQAYPAEHNCYKGVILLILQGCCRCWPCQVCVESFMIPVQVVASYLCGKREVWLLLGKGFTSLLADICYRDGTWIWDSASLCVGAVCTLTLNLVCFGFFFLFA